MESVKNSVHYHIISQLILRRSVIFASQNHSAPFIHVSSSYRGKNVYYVDTHIQNSQKEDIFPFLLATIYINRKQSIQRLPWPTFKMQPDDEDQTE